MLGFALVAACQPQPADQSKPAAEAVPESGPVRLEDGFMTPESVLYNAADDVYLVSNINGDPLAADDNGYISRITAADRAVDLRWIDGAAANVRLDAPKGMAIAGNDVWIADITVLRRFDKNSGEQKPDVAIPGSLFLNDVTAAADGTIYVTDTGLRSAPDGFAATDMAAIYRISPAGAVEKIASGGNLNQPTGLAMDGTNLWAVTFGANEIYQVASGGKTSVQMLPKGSLDGVVRLDDGTFLVSSWEVNGIYRGPASGPFNLVLEGTNAPADIDFDSRRNLVLIPHLTENAVSLQPIQK
jgi:sugar lactone lactonase YvrE